MLVQSMAFCAFCPGLCNVVSMLTSNIKDRPIDYLRDRGSIEILVENKYLREELSFCIGCLVLSWVTGWIVA